MLSFICFILSLTPSVAFAGGDGSKKAGAADPNDPHYTHYVTRPDLGAPRWNISMYDEEAISPGYWFVAPYAKLEQNSFPTWNGPHIFDGAGELIWSGAEIFKHHNAYDFRVVQVHGEQMLSVIVPHDKGQHADHLATFPELGEGDGFVLDSSYNVYEDVDIRNGHADPNMHDLTIFDDGKRALMLTQKTYDPSPVKIGKFNRPCNVGWQGFRDVNLETGEVIFEWDAEGHIDPYESDKKTGTYVHMCDTEWDILHFNSVDIFEDGDYLLCARHTSTIYKVSHLDGSIVWRLGGSNSDFEFLEENAKFSRQHHAKVYTQNETHTLVSLFNNARGTGKLTGDIASSTESSGLLLALRTDITPMTVEVVNRYPHPDGAFSPSRGSLSFMENGNAFLGWVSLSLISEHAADGRLLFKARLGPGENTYRSFKFPWVGRPSLPPDVVSAPATNDKGGVTTVVHVSWNGATEVATWKLLHTDATGDKVETIAEVPRQGFETALVYGGFAEYVMVAALDSSGKEIGRSKTVQTERPLDPWDVSVAEETEWQEGQSANTDTPSTPKPPTTPDHSTPAPKVSITTDDSSADDATWLSIPSIGSDYAAFGFALGLTFTLIAGAVVWRMRRRRMGHGRKSSWWSSSRSVYQPVSGHEDDDLESDAQMLHDKHAT